MGEDFGTPAGEDVSAKFEAAWQVFSATCAGFVAPEASYQAWLAHYLISQFGIDRVAREPIFKHAAFASPFRDKVPGGEVKLDAVVTRSHGLPLPHYAHRGGDRTGFHTLREITVITELKVAATQGQGLSHTEVAQDIYKLSMLLDELTLREGEVPGPVPLAYMCILDNHPKRAYNRAWLARRLERDPKHPGVRILYGGRKQDEPR